jgi:serine protease Do
MPSRLMHPAHGRLVIAAALALALGSAPAAARGPDGFSELAEKLTPAVVNIATTHKAAPSGATTNGGQGTPFDEFFHDFFGERDGNGGGKDAPAEPSRPSQSLGSGFIIDRSGLVVTNNHVIADADSITVTLADDTNLPAEVVGRDVVTDLALLKVEAKQPLSVLSWGDSNKARVGDWVLAIGDPFGLGGTVTAGILSARAREINAGPYDDFLQTDASINRGNSGGPMFNMAGEVIGINTAIYSPSGGSIGIGFAIPSNLARPVVEQLRDFGHTRRGWLGVNIQSVTDEIAESLGLDKPKGALIASVRDGGPAQVAGVQAGDVVLTFDGKDVTDMRHLPRIVAETPIDKTVKVKVWRKRKEHVFDVKVGELKEEDQQAAASPKQPPPGPVAGAVKALGLSLANLTPELRERFSLSEDTAGVVVTDVATDSPASEKGMRAGDVIVEVAQEEVKSPGQITGKIDEAKKAGRKSVLMLVDRQGDLRFVALKIDQG